MDEMREFVFIPGFQIAIRIQIAERGLELGVILTVRMSVVFDDGTSSTHGHSAKKGNNEEYLAFVAGIRI